jgi:hypothetical protein
MNPAALTLVLAMLQSPGSTPAAPVSPAPVVTTAAPGRSHLRVKDISFGPTAMHDQAPTALAEWQRQYDAAKARKDGGKKKMLYGLIAEGAGVAMILTSPTSCSVSVTETSVSSDCGSGLRTLGLITTLGGGGVFMWGAIEFFDARGDVSSLESNRPRTSAPAILLGEHHAISVSLGQRSTVAYHLTW